uniref:Tetraspanin n=1 Tax=Anopheles culicifacies TaxID=139723 RepID=A0A182LTQ5_9DIPT
MHTSRKALNMIKYLILMLTFMCVYAGMFGLVVILEIILASAAFSMYNRVDSMLTRRMNIVIQQFHNDRFMRASFNHMQTSVRNIRMSCCGIQSYVDWSNFHPDQELPTSCCRRFEEGCMPFERGCHSPMSDFIGSRIHMIATGTTIIIVFQVVCIITAIIMGARLSVYKRRLREAGMSTGTITAPEPILTEKPKY